MSHNMTPQCPNCASLSILPHISKPSDRLLYLLRRNEPPLDAELHGLRHNVCDCRDALREIDEKIAVTEQTLAMLRDAREEVDRTLQCNNALLQPIRSVPSDVLAEIFGHCLPNWDGRDRNAAADSLDPRLAPWTLTRVCARWRDVALASPILWSSLKLDISESLQSRTLPRPMAQYKLGLYLQRSKQCELYIQILNSRGTGISAFLAHLPALHLSAPRWRSLEFGASYEAMTNLLDYPFPRLRQITLLESAEIQSRTRSQSPDYYWMSEFNEGDQLLVPAGHLPALSSLVIEGSFPASRFQGVPWHQLKTLSLPDAFDVDAFDVDTLSRLSKMPRLEELSLDIISDYHHLSETNTRMPNLRCLTLIEQETASHRALPALFEHLDLPKLSELKLLYPTVPDMHPRSYFPTHFNAPPDHLTRLQIHGAISTSSEHLLEFLALTTNVREFVLADASLTLEFLHGMLFTPSSPLLPCLEVLSLPGCEMAFPVEAENVWDALEARLSPNSMESFSSDSGDVSPCVALREVTLPGWMTPDQFHDRRRLKRDLWASVRVLWET